MSRAGRWQAHAFQRWQSLFSQHEFFETLLGFRAVEVHARDVGMLREEGGEVVCFFVLNVAVQAAFAFAGVQHIPQRDAAVLQALQSFGIGQRGMRTDEVAHDLPEGIVRVGVILLLPQ